MATGDVGLGVLDSAAVVDSGAVVGEGAGAGASEVIEAPEINAGDGSVEGTGTREGTAAGEGASDGDGAGEGEKTGEGADKGVGAAKEQNPAQIRQVLKQLRSSGDPASVQAAKQLHQQYEYSLAYAKEFPTVKDAREARQIIDAVGGLEGIHGLQDTIANVEEVDAKIYAGDGSVWDDLVEDMKHAGKLDALKSLAPAFLDKIASSHPEAYANALAPHVVSGLRDAGFVSAINGIARAINAGDTEGAKELIKGIADWYKGLQSKSEQTKLDPLKPERDKLAQERADYEKGKQTEFKTSVGTEADKDNNRLLGSHLKTYLKMPFFRSFNRENLIPLGNAIKQELFSSLKADATYQLQMKTLWSAKSPDRSKIIEYHRARVESIAPDVVRRTVQRMYPGYAKGGSAAGRVAASAQKAEQAQAAAKNSSPVKPTYVATKPKWESIDWSADPKQTHYIMGRAKLKTGQWVTWRKQS